jgi:hypothetical protein
VGQFSTFSYFFYFLVLIPLSTKVDSFFLENGVFAVANSIKTRIEDIYYVPFF